MFVQIPDYCHLFGWTCVCVCAGLLGPIKTTQDVLWLSQLVITVVFPVRCLLKQHHSLIFNNLINSISWELTAPAGLFAVLFYSVLEVLRLLQDLGKMYSKVSDRFVLH